MEKNKENEGWNLGCEKENAGLQQSFSKNIEEVKHEVKTKCADSD